MSIAGSSGGRLGSVLCGAHHHAQLRTAAAAGAAAASTCVASHTFTTRRTAAIRVGLAFDSPLFSSTSHEAASTALTTQVRCKAIVSSKSNKQRRGKFFSNQPDDPLEFIAMNIRSTVRTTGPIPLSKLSPLLPDEFLETISQQGIGIAAFLSKYPNYCHTVELPGHVIVAMQRGITKPFGSEDRQQLATWIMALLSITNFLPGQPQVVALGLSSPHPTVEELVSALRRFSPVHPGEVETLLRSAPDLFNIAQQTRRVRFLIVNPIAPKQAALRAIAGGLVPRLHDHPKVVEESKFALWLRTVVPSQFHVPISHVMARAAELNVIGTAFGTPSPTLEQIKRPFQFLPPGFADIRAFGDGPNTVFIRIINPEPLLLETGVPAFGGSNKPPEMEAGRYDPTALAHALTTAIARYAAQSPLTRARVARGVEVARLRDYVPAELMTQLEAFYGFGPKDDPSVCILLLDRLRHLWEVQFNGGRARPWAFLPESEMPSSLTLQTSPSPRVLLHCQRLLVECGGQPMMDLYEVLPSDLKTVFLQLYGTTMEGVAAAAAPDEAAPSASGADDAQAITAALQTFLRTHSLFFFTENGEVHTSRARNTPHDTGKLPSPPAHASSFAKKPESTAQRQQSTSSWSVNRPPLPVSGDRRAVMASSQGPQSNRLTEGELARKIHDILPPDDWVVVDSLRNFVHKFTIQSENGKKSNKGLNLRREFFARHHSLLKLHSVFGFDKLIVSRAEFEVTQPHLLCPRIVTIGHLLKMMALLSLDSISDASLTRRLSHEGRMLVRSLGTVTDLAEQLPMWFVVHRDEFNFGSSLIRYIGPLAKVPRTKYALKPPLHGTLTRKVPNDPFRELPPDLVTEENPDEWNDDWNEDIDYDLGKNSNWSKDEDH